MSPEKSSKPTKLCPTCGTRVSEDAARCLVCGTDLTSSEKAAKPGKAVQGARMPEVTLNLPAAIGLLALFIAIGAGLVYFAMRQTQPSQAAVSQATPSPTTTLTITPTLTPTAVTPTITNTPPPTPTPLVYSVKLGDSCGAIAYNFQVSVNSIVLMNPELSADCANIFEGQKLLIPQPTATPTPPPTATLSAAEATEAACEKVEYTVAENDTLGKIAANYLVSKDAISEYNGLVNDIVRFGQKLVIPLCRRESTPGPTPTATPPPPYAAPDLLLPHDGAPFTSGNEVITLQWASVGALRDNERYAVTIEDITEGESRKQVDYVTDTKYIVPAEFHANDATPHAIRWWVMPVRQTGTDDEGKAIWEAAGAPSAQRVFIWGGTGGAPAPTVATTQAP